MMGTFYIILTLPAVIGFRFKDVGLRDALIQGNTVSEGSVDTMLSGSRAYKRAIRIYKILYESFSRIPFDDFEMECTSECNGSLQILDEIDKTYDFNELPKRNKPHEYCTSLITYEDNLGEKKCIIKLLAKLH